MDDPYEAPSAPDVTADLSVLSIEAAVKRTLLKLEALGFIAPSRDGITEDDRLLDPSLSTN